MKSSFLLLALSLCACSSGETPPPGTDGGGPRCDPGAECTRVGDCLAEVDQTGVSEPALRITQLTVTSPAALATGLVTNVIAGAILPSAPSCNLPGGGTANWILQITGGGTGLTVGAALPRASGSGPFELVQDATATPAIMPAMATLSGSGELTSSAFDVVLPLYLDDAGETSLTFPMHRAVVTMTPDASRTCVGSYDADGLDPAGSCLPDATHPAFLESGSIRGYITLEEADTLPVAALSQSLCVLLSGDPTTFGDGSAPVNLCKRTGGVIDFRGDWCDATDSAATESCHDAVRFEATFAASGVSL